MESQPLLNDVTGTGDPIVLMPGGLTGWASWIPLVGRLSDRHRVVRMQLRSVQRAEAGDPHPADYGTLTEREGLRVALDGLGLDRIDLVGWSYGAHVSLAFALQYPNRVRTLTVIEPPAGWILRETGWNPSERARIEAFDREMTGRELTSDDLKAFLVRAGFGPAETEFEALPTWPSWFAHRQALAINGTLWDYTDTLGRLRGLRVPVLAVLGTESPDSFRSIVETIVTAVPNARLLELPGGHACHLQNPDRFLDALEAHLARV